MVRVVRLLPLNQTETRPGVVVVAYTVLLILTKALVGYEPMVLLVAKVIASDFHVAQGENFG